MTEEYLVNKNHATLYVVKLALIQSIGPVE